MRAHYIVNLTVASNEDLRQAFRLTDSAGAPIDLTGATMKMRIDAPTQIDATTANGMLTIPTPATGAFCISIPTATIGGAPLGSHIYDVVLTLGGVVSRIMSGTVSVKKGVA